jgi:hypothetical protein
MLQPTKQVGFGVPVSVSEFINPLYIRIRLPAGMLRNAQQVRIRLQGERDYAFIRNTFARRLNGVPNTTMVVFGKNFTLRQLDQHPRRQLEVTVYSRQRGRVLASSTYVLQVQPHPAETLTKAASQIIFEEIALGDFADACRPRLKAFTAQVRGEIFIGEEEQKFPSLEHLDKLQRQGTLEGYSAGCHKAYVQCLNEAGRPIDQGSIQRFCTSKTKLLERDIF